MKEKVEISFDEIEWNVETEIQLFFAMNGHKPVGRVQLPPLAVLGYISCLLLVTTAVSRNCNSMKGVF